MFYKMEVSTEFYLKQNFFFAKVKIKSEKKVEDLLQYDSTKVKEKHNSE